MRLWSIHPAYLDSKGLVALWREGLLAQKVLAGETVGYRQHPQLIRFRESGKPLLYIGSYLAAVCLEAQSRSYAFQQEKILQQSPVTPLEVNSGQLEYEFRLLLTKLKERDLKRWQELVPLTEIKAHPLFCIRSGGVERWEKIRR